MTSTKVGSLQKHVSIKYVRDPHRVHVQKNPRYKCPLTITKMEWKSLLDDAKEKTLKKEGKTLPDQARYLILLIM